MYNSPLHKFHIPVMGLAYTIDSPVKVARYGIGSVISIVEDRLIEMMRSYYYPSIHKVYYPISNKEEDYRAKRITDYLNLVNTIVHDQVEKIKKSAFETGSEIVKYFEMLPDDSKVKQLFRHLMNTENNAEKENTESFLRTQIVSGSIDVNILTKTDRNNFDSNGEIIEDGSDAVAALRGYANSDLSNSSIIFSAGMNPRLYNYLERFNQFDANDEGQFKKKVVIKVSDYRSAIIQGKYLAKKGIWVSEFRIESGLNCGGHAFATDGYLMGPILEEFKTKKEELTATIFEIYNNALKAKGRNGFSKPHPLKITAQGGIGTHEESEFLQKNYNVESCGWGTPFLLVPEATTVDESTLKLLCDAKEKDVILSRYSPLGVRFYYLKNSSSEKEKFLRIQNGKPGSPCPEKHLSFNSEFTKEPICIASHKYQKLKIEELKSLNLSESEYQKQLTGVVGKECLCVGLSNAAALNYKQTFVKNQEAVNICPGPNIVNFSKVVSLQTMTDHIYGRKNILSNNSRPHMFITELHLYIDYLKEQLEEDGNNERDNKKIKYYQEFFTNLINGISYYRQLIKVSEINKGIFICELDDAENELNEINFQFLINNKTLETVTA